MVKVIINLSPIKYAVNGLAMGYFTGNMIELFTGRSVIDNISNKLNPDSQVVQSNPGGYTDNNLNTDDLPQGLTDSTHNTIGPDTVPDVQPIPTSIDTAKTVEEAIKAGKSVDISSLHYGGVSSVSNPIALNTAAGQHVLFDQAVILENGQEMWHMAQADAAGNLIGKGYAWFPKEQVIEAVQGLSQTGITR